MSNNVPLMDEDAQRLYLNAMLSNPEIFTRASGFLKPQHFDPQYAKGVKFIIEYFQENRHVPATSIFTTATKIPTDNLPMNRSDMEWTAKELAKFCRFREVINVIQKSAGQGGYLEKGQLNDMLEQMKHAINIELEEDVGIDYFDNPMARLENEEEDQVISTGWKSVDAVIGGGIGRQELILFLAPSGGGKSVGMLNLAYNLMMQGLSGVYISLEMRDRKVARRTDQMIARIASDMIDMNRTQVAHEIEKFSEKTGVKFFIKRMRETTTNANHISAYLDNLRARRAFEPDFVIADYLDIMDAARKGAGDSMFLKDKYVSEEVRAIGMDRNAIMISGSQLGKHATEAIEEGRVIHQGDVQGGSSKTNTSDLQITMEKTLAMHEAGLYRFGFPKSRNSDATGRRIEMAWNKRTLKISDKEDLDLVQKPKRPGLQMGDVRPGKDGQRGLGDLPQ